MKFNVPGRLIDFYQGGGAYQAWTSGDTKHPDWPERDERELFQAVSDGKVRRAKGGYWVATDLTDEAVHALRYWATTLETASQDDARHDPDARNDLRAALKVLAKI
jgi:hypothetical protein